MKMKSGPMDYRVLVLAASLALAGCGGGGSHTNSPFVGAYSGTFTTSDSQSGTLQGTVSNSGSLTGSGQNTTAGVGEVLSGSIKNSGDATITFTTSSGAATASGTLAFASNGHLDGTLNQSTGGTVTVDLIPQAG